VKVVKREKRGSHCLPEQGVVTAPAPAQIVPKGKLSDEFIIEVLAQKYQQHLPIYRQQAVLADNHGIELSRKTLTDAVLAAGGLLQAVVGAQKRELLAAVMCRPMKRRCLPDRGKNRSQPQAFMWEYSVPGGVVVFDFQLGRGRAGPKEFLQGFQGKLQCDGYDVYDNLGEGIVYAGCLTHARRKFVDAAKLAPLDPLPQEMLTQFGNSMRLRKKPAKLVWTPHNVWPCANKRACRDGRAQGTVGSHSATSAAGRNLGQSV